MKRILFFAIALMISSELFAGQQCTTRCYQTPTGPVCEEVCRPTWP